MYLKSTGKLTSWVHLRDMAVGQHHKRHSWKAPFLRLYPHRWCCSVVCHVCLFVTHRLQHARPPCPSPSLGVCPSSCSLHWWCCLAISSSNALFFFCPTSFPASGTFPVSHLFGSDDQNTGTSALASVLPVNIQGWSPFRLTGLISLLSKGLSGVFSSTTVRRHQFFGILPSLQSSSHNCTWPLGGP